MQGYISFNGKSTFLCMAMSFYQTKVVNSVALHICRMSLKKYSWSKKTTLVCKMAYLISWLPSALGTISLICVEGGKGVDDQCEHR